MRSKQEVFDKIDKLNARELELKKELSPDATLRYVDQVEYLDELREIKVEKLMLYWVLNTENKLT